MIQRLLFVVLAGSFVVLAFLFAAVFVALGITAALAFAVWAWWRGRKTRAIEGEYRVIEIK
jgi:hypothetical protein